MMRGQLDASWQHWPSHRSSANHRCLTHLENKTSRMRSSSRKVLGALYRYTRGLLWRGWCPNLNQVSTFLYTALVSENCDTTLYNNDLDTHVSTAIWLYCQVSVLKDFCAAVNAAKSQLSILNKLLSCSHSTNKNKMTTTILPKINPTHDSVITTNILYNYMLYLSQHSYC